MPTIGASIAIVQGKRVLLQLRRDFPVWCLPGGAIEEGESLAQAAIREAREETGLEVELTRLVGVYSRPQWWRGGDHEVVFAARPLGGDMARHGYETVDLAYFGRDNLPETLLWWYHQRILDALDGTVGVVRLQDAAWPYPGKTRRDVEELREQVLLTDAEYIRELCGSRRLDQEQLEVPSALNNGCE